MMTLLSMDLRSMPKVRLSPRVHASVPCCDSPEFYCFPCKLEFFLVTSALIQLHRNVGKMSLVSG
jgi:hypothetical protein